MKTSEILFLVAYPCHGKYSWVLRRRGEAQPGWMGMRRASKCGVCTGRTSRTFAAFFVVRGSGTLPCTVVTAKICSLSRAASLTAMRMAMASSTPGSQSMMKRRAGGVGLEAPVDMCARGKERRGARPDRRSAWSARYRSAASVFVCVQWCVWCVWVIVGMEKEGKCLA